MTMLLTLGGSMLVPHLFGRLLDLYVRSLLNGNPFAMIFTIIWVVGVSAGPLYQGLSKGDPAAIGLMSLVGVLCLIFLVIGIVDKKVNTKKSTAGTSARKRWR